MTGDPNILPLVEFTTDRRGDGQLKDPINLVFIGALADPASVYDIVRSDLGLRHDKGLSDQFFSEPADPTVAHRQDFNQSNHFISGWWTRFHTRVYSVFTGHQTYGRLTVAPIHIDHWVKLSADPQRCGRKLRPRTKVGNHNVAGSGSDIAVIPLRTFDPIRQCDGERTATDGRCAIVAPRGTVVPAGVDSDSTQDEP